MEDYPLAYDDIAACQLSGGKDVRKCGMIRKKSGGFKIPLFQSKYDLRFVIIKKGWVYYYEEKTSKKPQNKFSLQGFSNRVINAEEEQTIMPYAFKIYPMAANTRTWYFACENQQEMDDWMESFRLEIEQYNNRGSNISRQSRSCPDNPVRSFNPHITAYNRPQSINNPNINAKTVPSPPGYFLSRSDITSGIGSSTSSLEPQEGYYEPFEEDTDEFSTDSEDYENPVYYEEPEPEESTQYRDSGFNPLTMKKPFTPISVSHGRNPSSSSSETQAHGVINELASMLPGKTAYRKCQQPSSHPKAVPGFSPHKPYSKQTEPVPRNGGYGFAMCPLPAVPPPNLQRPLSYAHAAEPTYRGGNLPLPKRPVSSLGIGDAFVSKPPSHKSPPSPPTRVAPKLSGMSHKQENQYPGLTPNTSNYPKHDLPRQSFQPVPVPSTHIVQNQRLRSEETIDEEERLATVQKHKSMPSIPFLANELALKFGARPSDPPALPRKDYEKSSQQSDTDVNARRVSSPAIFSPAQPRSSPIRSPKPLPAVPEFPSRPPPLLPASDIGRDNFNVDQEWKNNKASRFPFASPKPHAQSFDQFSPLPSKYSNESHFTTGPALPPKPRSADEGFSKQLVQNDKYHAGGYDDTLSESNSNVVLDQEDPGIYDNMKDDEPTIIYENEEGCVKQSFGEVHAGSPNEVPPVEMQLVNEYPKVPKQRGNELLKEKSWQGSKVHSQNERPGRCAPQEDSEPEWIKSRLKSVPKPTFQPKDNPPVQKKDTGPISHPEKKVSIFDSQTQPRPSWQKSGSLDNQNQAKPYLALKPTVSKNPKPNLVPKPATSQKPSVPKIKRNFPPQSAVGEKPSPPAKPKPNSSSDSKPASNFAAARSMFE